MNAAGARAGARSRTLGAVLAGAVAVSACDLTVLNPVNIADADLVIPAAIPGLVNGAISDFGLGMLQYGGGGTVVAGAVLTDELTAVGSWVGIFGLGNGENRDDWVESQLRWGAPAKARWVLNNATQRVSEILESEGQDPSRHVEVATTRLYAGFANRVLGDNFCEAIRDGGPLENFRVYFEEAEERYTQALTVAQAALAGAPIDEATGQPAVVRGVAHTADEVVTAAYAGRAQVRMMLAGLNRDQAKWEQALADAAQVPTDFVIEMRNSTAGRNRNEAWYWTRGRAETSVWGTPFQEWGINWADPTARGDHRVRYDTLAWTGNPRTQRLGLDNRRPFIAARKWLSRNNNMPLATGTEARLIEAEAAVVRGDYQTLVAKINEVRQFRNDTRPTWWRNLIPLVETVPTNAQDAWFLLMKERGMEFWLEGRRLPDLRRWEVTPGREMVPFTTIRRPALGEPYQADEKVSVYDVEERLCIEIAQNEKLANPNLR